MGTAAMIMMIEPGKSIEQRDIYTCYLHRDLFGGGPVARAIKELLTPREYDIIYPDRCETDEDLDKHPRDPQELISAFTVVYDYLRKNTDQFPLCHWLNKYDDGVIRWSSSVSLTTPDGEQWNVHGVHEVMEHRNDVKCVLQNNKREIQWIPARPDIIVAGKAIRVRTETWFEFYRPIIETIFWYGWRASDRNLQLSWTVK